MPASAWIRHVKAYHAAHGGSYKDALTRARASYRSPTKLVTKRSPSKHSPSKRSPSKRSPTKRSPSKSRSPASAIPASWTKGAAAWERASQLYHDEAHGFRLTPSELTLAAEYYVHWINKRGAKVTDYVRNGKLIKPMV